MPRPDIDLGQLSDPLGSKWTTSAFFSPDEIAGIAAFVRKIPKWPVVSLERDWGRLRLTKNGGGRNNSICGNLPSDEHPPASWVVADDQDDHKDDFDKFSPGNQELIVF